MYLIPNREVMDDSRQWLQVLQYLIVLHGLVIMSFVSKYTFLVLCLILLLILLSYCCNWMPLFLCYTPYVMDDTFLLKIHRKSLNVFCVSTFCFIVTWFFCNLLILSKCDFLCCCWSICLRNVVFHHQSLEMSSITVNLEIMVRVNASFHNQLLTVLYFLCCHILTVLFPFFMHSWAVSSQSKSDL